jgi:hypothetical protein
MKIHPTHLSYLRHTPVDETIHYRGHGQLESSPASMSVIHVISHELDHLAQFRSQAQKDGAEIRDIDIEIQYEIRNGKLVAVGGKTKVTSEYKKNSQPENNKFTYDFIEVEPVPEEESILQDKLNQLKNEINFFSFTNQMKNNLTKTTQDIQEERKILGLESSKEFLENKLKELREKKNISQS